MSTAPELDPFADDKAALVALVAPWAEVSGDLPNLYIQMLEALDSIFFSGREVILHTHDDESVTGACPYPLCDSETFYLVDRSERWNEAHVESDDNGVYLGISEADTHHETVGYRCAGCDRGVTMPAEMGEPSW